MRLRVVKLGGSLLGSPDLRTRLEKWLDDQPAAASLVVVGGGAVVDSIRELATLYDYGEELLHWLCIDLLEVSFRLMAAQLSDWTKIEDAGQLKKLTERGDGLAPCPARGLVRIGAFYDAATESALPLRLPRSWDTTSDSLAALLAHLVRADELVLLKSCSIGEPQPRTSDQWQALARQGIVDRAFPAASAGLGCVRCANL